MRSALIVSAVLHIAILAAAIVQFGRTESFSTAAVAALPVELVTIDEETDLTIGEVEAEKVVEEAAPETVEAEEPPAPEEAPGATDKPADTIATEDNARPDGAESSAPEPEAAPEPSPVESDAAEAEAPPPPPPAETPQAEPEPESAPAETEVAAIDPQEASPPAAVEPEPEKPKPTPETVVPGRKPPPPKRTERARVERQTEDAFNADRLSQLINRTDPTGGGSGSAEASVGTDSGRAAAALTLSEMDALRAQMQRCWNPPIGLAAGDELVVIVQIRLAPDGSVVNIDQVGAQNVGRLYDVAADAARRAVLQCQPYRLPTSKYDAWKDVQVRFDPRDLF